MSYEVELEVMRFQTSEYIAANPRELILLRPAPVDDGEGGVDLENTVPQPVQTFRLITQNESVNVVSETIDGEEVNPDFVLLGEWDANVKTHDHFTLDDPDILYQIDFVRDDNRYETWAGVTRRG